MAAMGPLLVLPLVPSSFYTLGLRPAFLYSIYYLHTAALFNCHTPLVTFAEGGSQAGKGNRCGNKLVRKKNSFIAFRIVGAFLRRFKVRRDNK